MTKPHGTRARLLGQVAALRRFPVKSMAGEDLGEAEVGWHGLEGDRRWGFLRTDKPTSGFPWLTIRESPQMWSYRATLKDAARPNASAVLVNGPTGESFDVTEEKLASELGAAKVMKLDRGTFDAFPVSILTRQTVTSLSNLLGEPVDRDRFRANVIIGSAYGDAFPEDSWVGHTIRIGGVRLVVTDGQKRCVMVNVDPRTGSRDGRVLRSIAREHGSRLGVYASVAEPGSIVVGDAVVLE